MEKSYEQKKQEILGKIFVTHEETLKMREEALKDKEEYYIDLDKIITELKEKIKDIDNQFGKILRNFELENNISDGSKEKELLSKLWGYFLVKIPENFKIPLTKYERKKHLRLRMERHKEALEKLRLERKNLNKEMNDSKQSSTRRKKK